MVPESLPKKGGVAGRPPGVSQAVHTQSPCCKPAPLGPELLRGRGDRLTPGGLVCVAALSGTLEAWCSLSSVAPAALPRAAAGSLGSICLVWFRSWGAVASTGTRSDSCGLSACALRAFLEAGPRGLFPETFVSHQLVRGGSDSVVTIGFLNK